jgi:2-methylcitrate dehydratase PrpD
MLLNDLAERALRINIDEVPAAARATARMAVLDTIGVTLAGAREHCVLAVRRASAIGADGPATLLGTGDRTSVLDAALVNGTAAHALDFDDCSNTMGGHPSAPIVPALWALGEQMGASGREVIEAYVTGFEVETKLGRAVNFHHYEKGWHPTATLGTFGAAAACARLAKLDVERFATALAIAASMAAGIKANFGTMTKPFHVGQAARNGLHAALLSAAGLTANAGALEDPQGFLNVYNGAGTYDPLKLLEGFAAPFDLDQPGVAFKRHPCCASTHPALDALLSILAEHGIKAREIRSIRSWTHPRRLRHTNRPDPRSGLDGKFSVQYVLARAALDGAVRVDHFTDAAVFDPHVRRFMERVEAAPHPDAVMETDEHFFAHVRVTTTEGEAFETFVDRPLGRDRDHPLPPGALEAKFRSCAGIVLDMSAVDEIESAVLDLESVGDIRTVSRAMHRGVRAPEDARGHEAKVSRVAS